MRKSFPKILTAFFLTVFILQIICLFFLLAAPVASQAADIQFSPQVNIPGYNFNAADKSTGNIANLVRAIYNYAIGIIGILAAVVLMVGGVLWIVAGGNATQIGEAKAWIGAALTGLVLALTSYLILSTVNPALVNLQTTDITKVGKAPDSTIGCCITTTETPLGKHNYKENIKTEDCTKKGGLWYKECPTTPCCAFTSGFCSNTSNVTEQQCRDLATSSGKTFRNYMADGRCSGNVGEGCVAY